MGPNPADYNKIIQGVSKRNVIFKNLIMHRKKTIIQNALYIWKTCFGTFMFQLLKMIVSTNYALKTGFSKGLN